ncbi:MULTISPECIES: ROK family transcriptional regulator [Nocardiopsis]|uniref:ROK family protein n=1 Tax=Nocardiopsis dassonvillei (strain ATCC 23218 / DSM 43111 / CIP 107115 / JCM 7437 / KCTC 9190 / NBRC 14626 / NCTC 10488 / NRRL B-5397 / IMRU 509) TaxID=446468 RepID=D7AYC0_NOCDD|nr:ROK family transcriptional regulator [Nocardiopsis dassonvillei]ADH66105.1 ROK family protein [Nocardiopsis dassonvillei subsp. dassonvillei DSM 43111]APC34439.1 sugar kinase [Nocardiopsis dassonvillei]NKY78655.1 ROK family transcriptional regulator [Nocardiopsis dassonvillei]VEI92125.1 Fructokinase [Nocardiopsis dassonvillei]
MSQRPGTPRLLRQLNDRAALELLLSAGPLTRTQLGTRTGLSKVTASQLLARLEERDLVRVVGSQAGGRGPNAALYAVVPESAYVAALDVSARRVTATIADITGRIVSDVAVDPSASDDPVALVHTAVMRLAETAGVALDRVRACVIGTPGVVDPRTGDIRFSFDLMSWHEGILEALRADLKRSVMIENDVNLAALAEHSEGAAAGVAEFVLIWLSANGGVGMSTMIDGRIHRGRSGGAGEIGYLPVPGAPMPTDVGLSGGYESLRDGASRELPHGFQALVKAGQVVELAAGYGIEGTDVTEVVGAASAAETPEADAFLNDFAERLARGVAAVAVILDPGLVVLGGDVARAGGVKLAERVQAATARIAPNATEVALGRVEGSPVVRGALLHALERAREDVFSSTV